MELLIGRNIKRLRRERELTQEEVAAHLGISFQAISKWERGDGYPDITMLPALAGYFGVSVDELLGMDSLEKQGRYDAINRKYEENRVAGRYAENVELMQAALKEWPNDALLLVQLSASMHHMGDTPEEKREYLKKAIAVEEQILRYGEDSEVRGATMYNICFSYAKLGNMDKAVEQARKLPNLYKARENALVFFLKGEERRNISRSVLTPLMWALSVHLKALAEEEKAPEYLDILKKIIEMVLILDDNVHIRNLI
ncbi:MAG: helix-turn-helix transcriptional regulator [Clostridia bacterium]|nr:helix-turn-helix transcriptional regulator [Clostridia bacterium]